MTDNKKKTKKQIQIENLQKQHEIQSKKTPLKRGDLIKVVVYDYNIPFKGLGLKVKILNNKFSDQFDSATIDSSDLFNKKELIQIHLNNKERFPEVREMKKRFPIGIIIDAKIKKVTKMKINFGYYKLNTTLETIHYYYKLKYID
jgi:hypothetical protein